MINQSGFYLNIKKGNIRSLQIEQKDRKVLKRL
jgi:hypothetical protein